MSTLLVNHQLPTAARRSANYKPTKMSSLLVNHQLPTIPRRSANYKPTKMSTLLVNHRLPTASRRSANYKPTKMSTVLVDHQLPTASRRSANYKPSIWDSKFIESLSTDFTEERYGGRVDKLKGDVVKMLNNVDVDQLELIDNLQRLGLAYHFDNEIKCNLKKIYENRDENNDKDLHATALQFRLLRHGGYYNTSQDVFNRFMHEGSFKELVSTDVNGMLSLYEATYFSKEGEDLMEIARCFTTETLQQLLLDNKIDDVNLRTKVCDALVLPLNWRISRLEARWYIDVYEKSNNMIPVLLELAKLDYNILQGIYQKELKIVSRWHENLGLCEKLKFARDRLVECYIWNVGMIFEPQFAYCRIEGAKLFQLITVLDDIYDVYGTLDELEIFTDAIERWDVNSLQGLPDYMKTCFLGIYNFVNEMVYQIFKEQNIDVLQYLKRGWVDPVKAYLVEARWYYTKYKPTLEEYMSNAMLSIAVPIILVQSYVCCANPYEKEALEFMDKFPDVFRFAAIAVRLADDYATTKDEAARGDVPTSIDCYMNHTGASEEVARREMMHLMRKTWKEMYNCRALEEKMPLSHHFREVILNLMRTGHHLYHNGDGFGVQDDEQNNMIVSLFAEPIPL